jgi:hypothetical protein
MNLTKEEIGKTASRELQNLHIFRAKCQFFLFLVAKNFMIHLVLHGDDVRSCDGSFGDESFRLPKWFDEEKFKKFVMDLAGQSC